MRILSIQAYKSDSKNAPAIQKPLVSLPGVSQGVTMLLVVILLAGCEQKPPKQPITTPSKTTPASAPAPVKPTTQPATQPATKPATQPASQPSSTYDPKPPYPVRLYVRSPEDKQPGWLKVTELADTDTMATCKGEFPERNRIIVDTENVSRLRLHIGHLPLAARKRIVLRIDDQGIELSHKKRAYVFLERRSTGEWVVDKSGK